MGNMLSQISKPTEDSKEEEPLMTSGHANHQTYSIEEEGIDDSSDPSTAKRITSQTANSGMNPPKMFQGKPLSTEQFNQIKKGATLQ